MAETDAKPEQPDKPKKPRKRTARAPAKTSAAVLAMADDPNVSDTVVAAALTALAPTKQRQVVASWTERVAAGEAPLVTRLLAMFELAALDAKRPEDLAPFIDPLREVGALTDVFTHVEAAFASENAAVREAVCGRWLADPRAQRVFDDLQIDKLIRCAVAIAESDEDSADRRAACAALRQAVHPGARDALMSAIRYTRSDSNPELRADLYAGIVANRGRHLVPFLVERLFEERAAYGPLVGSFGRVLDDSAHRYVMATLAQRAHDASVIHAATLYADTLARAKAKTRLLDLARAVHSWQPATNDDARRLRHVIELGIAAAVSLQRADDVRPLYARARQLPDSPYSDYHVYARNTRTPALLADPSLKRIVAKLEA
jgi:hypothetical protein